jgi:hypothetical protein
MDDHFVILQALSTGIEKSKKSPAELGQNGRSGLPALRYYRIPRRVIYGNRFPRN